MYLLLIVSAILAEKGEYDDLVDAVMALRDQPKVRVDSHGELTIDSRTLSCMRLNPMSVPDTWRHEVRDTINGQRTDAKQKVEKAHKSLAKDAWWRAAGSAVGNTPAAIPGVGFWLGTAIGVSGDVALLSTWMNHVNSKYESVCNFETLQDQFLKDKMIRAAAQYEYIEIGVKPTLLLLDHLGGAEVVTNAMTLEKECIGMTARAVQSYQNSRLNEWITTHITQIGEVLSGVKNQISKSISWLLAKDASASVLTEKVTEGVVEREAVDAIPIGGILFGAAWCLACMRHICGGVNDQFKRTYNDEIDAYYNACLDQLHVNQTNST